MTLIQEMRSLIAKRIDQASSSEILTMVSALCAEPPPSTNGHAEGSPAHRFQVEGDVVHDNTTGLTWSRENVPGGTMSWAKAKEACAALKLAGHDDWRLPTVRELLTLVDYERHDPSIDPVFQCDARGYWSSTLAAASPGDCAWYVLFSFGSATWRNRGNEGHVRAVRASQSSDLWHVR